MLNAGVVGEMVTCGSGAGAGLVLGFQVACIWGAWQIAPYFEGLIDRTFVKWWVTCVEGLSQPCFQGLTMPCDIGRSGPIGDKEVNAY